MGILSVIVLLHGVAANQIRKKSYESGSGIFAVTAAESNRVEIAKNVWMPKLTLNAYPNSTSWLQVGGRSMDSALDYGDARQEEMGAAVHYATANLNISREEIFVVTKVPCCPKQPFGKAGWPFLPAPNCTHARNTSKDVDYNLRTIGVKKIDLLLLHFTCDKFEDTLTAWRALEQAQLDGKVRSIGVSNFNQSDIEKLVKMAKIKPAVNQAGFAIGSPLNKTLGRDWGTINTCKALNITYMAYAPFGERHATAPTSKIDVLTDARVKRIAKSKNVSTALVGLRWILQHGLAVVTSAHRKDYQIEDLTVFTALNLTQEEMDVLDGI